MFSITWNNSFTDSLNDLLTTLSAVGNRNGQLCHDRRRPEDRPRAQVCILACSKGQGRGHDEICVKIYIWDIRVKSWGKTSLNWKNSFNKRLCTMTCKAFIYALLQEKRRFYHKPPFSGAVRSISELEIVSVLFPEMLKVSTSLRPLSPSSYT